MSTSWDDFPLVEAEPALEGGETVELMETGYGALVAWEAGPRHVRRVPKRGPAATVQITQETAAGPPVTWEEELSPDDLASIRADLNDCLAAAGIPPQPDGYHWLLELPPATATRGEFWRLLHRYMDELPEYGLRPNDTRRAIAAALARMGIAATPGG